MFCFLKNVKKPTQFEASDRSRRDQREAEEAEVGGGTQRDFSVAGHLVAELTTEGWCPPSCVCMCLLVYKPNYRYICDEP